VPELPGLPAAAAHRWLTDALGDPGDSGWGAEVISGGLSNITYRIRWGENQFVLRRPPLGPVLPRAHDMKREYRVLTALAGTPVPVPETVGFCADPEVIGAPFYLMREVSGTILRSPEDAQTLTSEQRAELSDQLVDALAELHTVDVADVGLEDYGRHGGYAVRQLKTWGIQWQRSRTRSLPDMDTLISELAGALPERDATTLVHGDYRFDNTIVTLLPHPRIEAILDWELSTLGDPIADLAVMLTYWHDRDDTEREQISVAAGLTTAAGFPTTSALAERYAGRTGRDLSDLRVHLALAAMKLGVILEGVHARSLGGQAVGSGWETVSEAVPILAARGLRLLRAPRLNSDSRGLMSTDVTARR
jgi:aminoglycoside phosphotransferase (APT) family kinase protein